MGERHGVISFLSFFLWTWVGHTSTIYNNKNTENEWRRETATETNKKAKIQDYSWLIKKLRKCLLFHCASTQLCVGTVGMVATTDCNSFFFIFNLFCNLSAFIDLTWPLYVHNSLALWHCDCPHSLSRFPLNVCECIEIVN